MVTRRALCILIFFGSSCFAAEIRGSGDGGELLGWKVVVEGEEMCSRPIALLSKRLIECRSGDDEPSGDAHVLGTGRLFGWRVVGGTSLEAQAAIVCSNPAVDSPSRTIICAHASD